MSTATAIDESLSRLEEQSAGQAAEVLAKAFQGEELVAKYKNRLERLREIREPMETKWQQVRDLLDPASSRWLGGRDDEDDSVIDDSEIRDTIPRKMAQTAADGLHGGLSNPAVQWFSYYRGNYSLDDSDMSREAKTWLKNAEECVRDVLTRTNFYLALHSLYREVLEFGCGLMLAYADPDKYVRFYNYTIGSYWCAQNNRRHVDTVYIMSKQSAKDLVDTYGLDRCPAAVKEALDDKDADRKFTHIQCIQPWNFFGDVSGHPDFQYEDVRFIEDAEDDEPVLARSGYRTKPFIFARWSESGDFVYPRTSPGIDALPDIRQLYKATDYYNTAVSWLSNPAFFYDSNLEHDIEDIRPGALISVTGAVSGKVGVQPIIPPAFDVENNLRYRAALVEKISNIFYNREIMMITGRAEQNHVMTAMEVGLLNQEKNAVLGPITTRTSYDNLVPALTRVLEIIRNEWHILDQAPADLDAEDIEPYFTSDMAVTQRQAWMHRANDVLLWLQQAAAVAGVELADTFDFDRWAREFEHTDMIPPFILRERSDVEEMRQQRAEAQAKQAQIDAMQKMGKAGKDLGQTPTTGDNAAAQMLAGGAIGG